MNIRDTDTFYPPVRVTDNAACKLEHEVDADGNAVLDTLGNATPSFDDDGTPIYKGAPYCQEYTEYTSKLESKYPLSLVSNEGIPLDGNTGASRPNMFLIPEGTSARVVLAYEESKVSEKVPVITMTRQSWSQQTGKIGARTSTITLSCSTSPTK